MIRVYRAITLEFCTSIEVNGCTERVIFSSGNMERNEGGVYTTRNPKEQEALEKHPLFGRMFTKEREIAEASDRKVVPPKVVSKTSSSPEDNGSGEDEDSGTDGEASGDGLDSGAEGEADKGAADDDVLTFAALKDLQGYLQKEHKVSFAEIRSKDAAFTKADELGIKYKIGE